ncbi:MAG: hypothetical protein QMC96_01920 [Methanomicrobiales archaeon]|nr:hypothetical protein [Methanomicrobiales archaeon]
MVSVGNRYAVQTLIGLAVLLTGVVTPLLWPTASPWISLFLMLAGIGFCLTGLVMLWKPPKEPVHDEWTRKIRAYAFSYAWMVTFFMIIGLYVVQKIQLVLLTAEETLVVLFFATTLSGGVLQWHFVRRGDVE